MEIIPYETDDYDSFMNNIVMIPEKNSKLNGFYKIIKSSNNFFYTKKMKCETKLAKINDNNTKIYEAIISNDFENDNFTKMIKKTSVNKKYPLVICSIVQYEI